jgi:hypothetical protein
VELGGDDARIPVGEPVSLEPLVPSLTPVAGPTVGRRPGPQRGMATGPDQVSHVEVGRGRHPPQRAVAREPAQPQQVAAGGHGAQLSNLWPLGSWSLSNVLNHWLSAAVPNVSRSSACACVEDQAFISPVLDRRTDLLAHVLMDVWHAKGLDRTTSASCRTSLSLSMGLAVYGLIRPGSSGLRHPN